jgi:hypothetical protein
LREQQLREHFANAGVDCLELQTDEPIDQALVRFTRLRKRRSQLATGVTASATGGTTTDAQVSVHAGSPAGATAGSRLGLVANTLARH